MNKLFPFIVLIFLVCSCYNKSTQTKIEGTWKLVYNEIRENDSIQVKDLTKRDFIKIINKTHFSFINQPKDSLGSFYAGGGTYILKENKYCETLSYIEYKAIRNHIFCFDIYFKGDTLIQEGIEKVESAGIERYIIEKYKRVGQSSDVLKRS